jgi:hypothetical protein
LGFLSKYECWVTDLIMALYHDNENLPIINKSKHSKKRKGGIQRTKWKDLCPRRPKKKKKSEPQREH